MDLVNYKKPVPETSKAGARSYPVKKLIVAGGWRLIKGFQDAVRSFSLKREKTGNRIGVCLSRHDFNGLLDYLCSWELDCRNNHR